VPLGAGVSSSAALEVSFATFLEVLFGLHVDPVTKALRCQRSEIEFAHTPCGIMDQFISCMGKKNHLLLIDCRHQTRTTVPFPASDVVLLVCNSNVKHSLGGSEYPVRVKQCEEAVEKVTPHVAWLVTKKREAF
jgi:galactokinase